MQSEENTNLKNLLKALGPGILIACAAIGASHLVWATKAGAQFGWSLLWLVVLANFLKFPFFYYGQQYSVATGESLLSGYKKLGKKYLSAFLLINLFTGTITIAAVGMLTAALCTTFLGDIGLSLPNLTIILIGLISLILISGRYGILDQLSKWIIISLTLLTIIAVFMALGNNSYVNKEFVHTNPYTLASLGFIISLLGWMPAPIDLSTWPSLWMHGREKQTGHKATPREVNIDFSIGYITTTILACLFLSLGALTIYGSGIELSSNGIKFSGQLIDLYSDTIGGFAKPIIIITAFFTMFSTTLTCLDGYPRSLVVSIELLREKNDKLINDSKYKLMIVGYVFSASILLFFFVNNLLQLLSFAAIIAFLTSPFLAWINLKVITSSKVPSKFQPPYWMRIISYLGITFFVAVSSIFLYSLIY